MKIRPIFFVPIFCFASFTISLIAFLAPTNVLIGVSLMNIGPSTSLTSPTLINSPDVDGVRLSLGPLHSCSKKSNDASWTCTNTFLRPKYDTSLLTFTTPIRLELPHSSTPFFLIISMALLFVFFVLFTMLVYVDILHIPSFKTPRMDKLCLIFGSLGLLIGVSTYVALDFWFQKTANDFNDVILAQKGSKAPELIAGTGSGFVLVWIAYALAFVPYTCVFMGLHLSQSPRSGEKKPKKASTSNA